MCCRQKWWWETEWKGKLFKSCFTFLYYVWQQKRKRSVWSYATRYLSYLVAHVLCNSVQPQINYVIHTKSPCSLEFKSIVFNSIFIYRYVYYVIVWSINKSHIVASGQWTPPQLNMSPPQFTICIYIIDFDEIFSCCFIIIFM